jgi:hypothetical protein
VKNLGSPRGLDGIRLEYPQRRRADRERACDHQRHPLALLGYDRTLDEPHAPLRHWALRAL